MWLFFRDNLCEPLQRSDVMQLKAEITMLTILGSVGFYENSVLKFKMHLDFKNEQIPDGSRLNENELCEKMLDALTKTGFQYISGDAHTEP